MKKVEDHEDRLEKTLQTVVPHLPNWRRVRLGKVIDVTVEGVMTIGGRAVRFVQHIFFIRRKGNPNHPSQANKYYGILGQGNPEVQKNE